MFLAKGVYPPFSNLFLKLFDKIFIFQMYRATYFKFELFVTFSFALLLGFFVLKAGTFYKKHLKQEYLFIIPFLIVIGVWPLISGQVARYFHKSEIPQPYNEARIIIKSDPLETKILSMPMLRGALLKWGEDNYFAGQYYQDNIFFMFISKELWLNLAYVSIIALLGSALAGLDKVYRMENGE